MLFPSICSQTNHPKDLMVSATQNVRSRMLRLKSKIIPWPAKHSLGPWHFSVIFYPFSWSLGFNISRCLLSLHPPPSLAPRYNTPNSGTLQLLFPLHGRIISTDTHMVPSLILFRSPEISKKSLLWLPSLNWPYSSSISLSCFDFHPTWHYIIYFNLLHCLCLQL